MKKRKLILPLMGICALLALVAWPALSVYYDGSFNAVLARYFVDMPEVTAPANPDANVGRLYVADNAATTTLYFLDSAGTATNLLTASAGSGTLDEAYDHGGAGVGKAITVDTGAIALTTGGDDAAIVIDSTTTINTTTTGVLDINYRSATTTGAAILLDIESDLAGGASELLTGIKIQLDDDANTASDAIRAIEIRSDGNGTGLQHGIWVQDAGIDAALYAVNGYVRIGDGNTPGVAPGDDDLFVEGTVEIDGNLYADGNIVGDGATVVSGTIGDVTDGADGGPYAVTIAMCGGTFYNSQAIQFNLPEASTAIGCELTFVVLHASNLDINPDNADIIVTATNSAGDMIRSATAGDTVTLKAMTASQWVVKSMYPANTDWADAN